MRTLEVNIRTFVKKKKIQIYFISLHSILESAKCIRVRQCSLQYITVRCKFSPGGNFSNRITMFVDDTQVPPL